MGNRLRLVAHLLLAAGILVSVGPSAGFGPDAGTDVPVHADGGGDIPVLPDGAEPPAASWEKHLESDETAGSSDFRASTVRSRRLRHDGAPPRKSSSTLRHTGSVPIYCLLGVYRI